jgi:hypothetical protein
MSRASAHCAIGVRAIRSGIVSVSSTSINYSATSTKGAAYSSAFGLVNMTKVVFDVVFDVSIELGSRLLWKSYSRCKQRMVSTVSA